MKRMHREGHQIASHSWSHQDFKAISPQQRRDQIFKLEISLVDILGFFPTYIRLPFSSWDDQVLVDLKRFGYHIVDFNLDTHDWEDPSGDYRVPRESFVSAVSSPNNASFIVVAHDIHEKTAVKGGYAQFMIDQAKKFNYDLVTVGECLEDPRENWYRDPKNGEQFGGPPSSSPVSKPQGGTPSVPPGGTGTVNSPTSTLNSNSNPNSNDGSGNGLATSGVTGAVVPPAASGTQKPSSFGNIVSSSLGVVFPLCISVCLWMEAWF